MKKIYALCCIATFTLCVACTDKQYDMKNLSDMNTDITFGGDEFALPIGSTEKIELEMFIETNDIFTTNSDGQYVISQSERMSIDLPVVTIPSFAPEIPAIDPINLTINTPAFPLPAIKTRATERLEAAIPDQNVSIGGRMSGIPQDVVALRSVSVHSGGMLNVSVKIDGLPSSVNGLRFENFQIKLPDYLQIAPHNLLTGSSLTLDKISIDRTTGFSDQLQITGLYFADILKASNGAINIEGQATISGGVSIPLNEISLPLPDRITMKITLSISPMEPGAVSGIFNPRITIDPVRFNIDNMPDFMTANDMVLDLYSVGIALAAQNPLGAKVDCGVNITPYNTQGDEISGGVVSAENITIKPNSTTKIWLSNREDGKPTGYEWVDNPTLPNLIKKLPSSIDFEMSAQVDQDTESTIDLQKQPYNMAIDYSLNAPIAVGSQFSIGYTTSIKDIKKPLAQYLKNSAKVILKASAENSVPLNLLLKAEAFDADSLPIGVSIELSGGTDNKGTVKAGARNGEVSKSDILISITERTAGELAKMDILTLTFKGAADDSVQGAPLKKNQYIKLSMSAKIPGGITFEGNGSK